MNNYILPPLKKKKNHVLDFLACPHHWEIHHCHDHPRSGFILLGAHKCLPVKGYILPVVWFGLCSKQQGAEGLTYDPVMSCPILPASRRTGIENTTWGRMSPPSPSHTKAGASPSQCTSFHPNKSPEDSAGPRGYLEIHLLPGAGHQVAILGPSEFKSIPSMQGGRAPSPNPGDRR